VIAINGDVNNDFCCGAVVGAEPESISNCNLYSALTADTDIRAQYEYQSENDYSTAWAWFAGVEQADLEEYVVPVEEETPVEEEDDEEEDDDEEDDDEDMSVRMTASALAAASFAMLAM